MVSLFLINRDKFLRERLGIEYDGEYNSIPAERKRKIIDKLIKNLQSKNCENSLIALLLIFQPVFKSLNTRFISTFSTKFDWTSDEFMGYLIAEFYKLAKFEFNRKGTKGFQAQFNRFIQKKLASKALCLLSKEKIRRKHHQVESKLQDSDGSEISNAMDKRFSLADEHLAMDTMQSLSSLMELFMEYAKDIDYIDDFSYERYGHLYKMSIKGYSNSEVARCHNMSVGRVSNLLTVFKTTSKKFIEERIRQYKYK